MVAMVNLVSGFGTSLKLMRSILLFLMASTAILADVRYQLRCEIESSDKVVSKSGALADAMLLFKDNSINLTWIESLPVPGCPNEYYFFVELEGHIAQPTLSHAIDALKQRSLRLDILGSYPRSS